VGLQQFANLPTLDARCPRHQVLVFLQRRPHRGEHPTKERVTSQGNPFGVDAVHIANFKANARWMAPPFPQFYRPSFLSSSNHTFADRFGKPLIFISNKYRKEWRRAPVNYLSVDVLRRLLAYLTPRYHIVYKRHTGEILKDFEDKEKDLGDKAMIRHEFPDVVLFEQLMTTTTTTTTGRVMADDPEDENLLMFTLMAASSGFVSVQGGLAVASSYFGGSNIILIKRGEELKSGSYGYFYRFSGANVTW
jgi:hypothetical protein